jgi:hypothetical protein
MVRTLTILFRRDPSRDFQKENIAFAGYQILWPDGRPVAVGLEAFCRQGQQVLGLRRQLADCAERLLCLVQFPLRGPEAPWTRIPGCRVRRFFLERQGELGRLHFVDGTPTAVVFRLGEDDPRVLQWCGLAELADGERLWFDLAALPLPLSRRLREAPHPLPIC